MSESRLQKATKINKLASEVIDKIKWINATAQSKRRDDERKKEQENDEFWDFILLFLMKILKETEENEGEILSRVNSQPEPEPEPDPATPDWNDEPTQKRRMKP